MVPRCVSERSTVYHSIQLQSRSRGPGGAGLFFLAFDVLRHSRPLAAPVEFFSVRIFYVEFSFSICNDYTYIYIYIYIYSCP